MPRKIPSKAIQTSSRAEGADVVNPLTEAQKGYLAGLIDGEGCISLGRNLNLRSGNYDYGPAVCVTNTNRDLLVWCKAVTGIGIVPNGSIAPNPKAKIRYVWRLRADEIVPLLPVVLPYLVIKQVQAELLIEYLSKCRGSLRLGRGRGNGQGCEAPSDEVAMLRAIIFSELADLNRRGV